MKWQKIGNVLICGALTSEILIISIVSSDNELVAKLPSMYDQPHIPHNNYPVPQYSNIVNITNSTSGTASVETLLNFQAF